MFVELKNELLVSCCGCVCVTLLPSKLPKFAKFDWGIFVFGKYGFWVEVDITYELS